MNELDKRKCLTAVKIAIDEAKRAVLSKLGDRIGHQEAFFLDAEFRGIAIRTGMLLAPGKLDDTRGLEPSEEKAVDIGAMITNGVILALTDSKNKAGEGTSRIESQFLEAISNKVYELEVDIKARPRKE